MLQKTIGLLATIAALIGASVASSGAALAAALPQQPGRPAVLMLRDPLNRPVENALGLVLTDPDREFPALAELGPVELFFRHEPTAVGSAPSRRTGMLMCDGGKAEDPPRPGAVLILADGRDGDNLTAFVERMLPGDADRVKLVRAGHVTTDRDGESITVFPAALIDGRRIVLPAMRGTSVPLPPGRYEAWIERSADGEITWQQVDIESGKTVTADFGGPTRELVRHDGTLVTAAGRADVILVDSEHQRRVLCGKAATAPLTARFATNGRIITASTFAFPTDPANDPALEVKPSFATPPTGNVLGFVLSRNAFGDWRVRGAAALGEGGTLRLPEVKDGDDWLLITAPECAPFALPMIDVKNGATLTIPDGVPLAVACRFEGGDPARDVVLEYVPRHTDIAAVRVRTDRRGNADFGRVTLPGSVRASDARYANVEMALDAAPAESVSFTLPDGIALRGTVQLPDGTAAAGVTVTLTAPHDALRPKERSTVTGADGTFVLPGLADENEYVIFATTRRGDRTWSSSVGRFLAGGEPLVLTIHNEDPQLGPDK